MVNPNMKRPVVGRTIQASAIGLVLGLALILPPGGRAKLGQPAMGQRTFGTQPSTALPVGPQPPVASFLEVTLEHHVRMRGRNGFVIHLHLKINDRQNINCRVEAYFYDSNNKEIKAAPNAPQTSSGGTAVVWREIKPGYPSTEYKDFQIFVPTTTFHALPKGAHELKTIVYVESQSQLIGKSGERTFTLTL